MAHQVGGAKRLSLLPSPLARVGGIQSQRAVFVCVIMSVYVLNLWWQ